MMDNKHEKDFIESVKNELYIETFLTDEPDFSEEKIDTLVRLLELDNPTDEQKIEEEMNRFLKQFKKDHRKEIWRRRVLESVKKAAVILILVFAADLTTQAVANESLFSMVSKWTNQIVIRPGRDLAAEELASVDEREIKKFSTVEEFADYFNDDFLVCSWLPEGVELGEILISDGGGSFSNIWKFKGEKNGEWKIRIQINQDVGNNIAGFTGTLDNESTQTEVINGLSVTYFENKEGYCAGFEYHDWWYFIEAHVEYDVFKTIIEGMVEYE